MEGPIGVEKSDLICPIEKTGWTEGGLKSEHLVSQWVPGLDLRTWLCVAKRVQFNNLMTVFAEFDHSILLLYRTGFGLRSVVWEDEATSASSGHQHQDTVLLEAEWRCFTLFHPSFPAAETDLLFLPYRFLVHGVSAPQMSPCCHVRSYQALSPNQMRFVP